MSEEIVSEIAVVPTAPMKEIDKKIFGTLSEVDLSEWTAKKNNLTYLPWATAYTKLMQYDPEAVWSYHSVLMDDGQTKRPWFDDGISGWVETEVTAGNQTKTMMLPIMDFKNQAIPAEKIRITDANKSIMRCLVKNIAMFGLGIYLYQGEDLPEAIGRLSALKEEIKALAKKKVMLGETAKKKVNDLLRKTQKEAFPDLPDDQVSGAIDEIEDEEILKHLKNGLMAIRQSAKKEKATTTEEK